jgi:hypothetical protein
MFGVQAELNFEGKGAKGTFHEDMFHNDFDVKTKLGYIVIPVLGQIGYFGKGPQYYGQIGPYIGILTYASGDDVEVIYDSNWMPIGYQETSVKKASYKGVDFGITLGAGARFPITNTLFVIVDGRYNLGLMDINNVETGPRTRTGAINLSVGVLVTIN